MSRWGDIGLLRLSLLILAGRRFWVLPLLPLLWLGFQAARLLLGLGERFEPVSAQGTLIGLPLTMLAVFLGLRIIAGEIDGRSLEIAYTVPGGCQRVWWAKLLAAGLVLCVSEVLLAVATLFFFTGRFPLGALYGAFQAAAFYLVLSMAMATLFRSEAAGAMGTAAVLGFNGLLTGFGQNQIRASPFWNPYLLEEGVGNRPAADPTELFAWTLQNRVGVVLVMAAILALAFMRANRRERMLG